MSTPEKDTVWGVFKPLLKKYFLPRWYVIALGIMAGMVAAAMAGFGLPFMTQYVFPIVFGTVEPPHYLSRFIELHVAPEFRENAVLWLSAALIPLVMTIRGLATYFNTYILTRVGTEALLELRTDVFTRLQWLPFSFFDRRSRGDIMTVVIQYTQLAQQGLMAVMNELVIQPLTLISAGGYLVYAACSSNQNATLLGNLIISCACIPIVRAVGKRMTKQAGKMLKNMGIITTVVEETFSAQREIRAFNLESHRESLLRDCIRKFNSVLIRMTAWKQSVTPSVEFVAALALAYSLYRGCSSGLTLEQFSAIAFAFYFCYEPVKHLSNVYNQCQVMAVGIRGINEILHAVDETPEPETPAKMTMPVAGAVDFENVDFGYNEEKTVLRNVNVHVPPGQVVALVGPSGSGKTTFINLICRFYDVNRGCVRLDGVDVRQISRDDRTRSIGLVSQFAALFNDTIYENIRAGRPSASREEVLAAARKARVDEFAESTPEGYELMLGESGSGLSGGQRQRISIARAFLKNAPVLILDEATSALDMKSEAAIQAELEELVKGHTTFVIAHRFSTIRMAQRILVFDDGCIIADGTHADLYETCSLYRNLYDEQVRQAEQERETEV